MLSRALRLTRSYLEVRLPPLLHESSISFFVLPSCRVLWLPRFVELEFQAREVSRAAAFWPPYSLGDHVVIYSVSFFNMLLIVDAAKGFSDPETAEKLREKLAADGVDGTSPPSSRALFLSYFVLQQ